MKIIITDEPNPITGKRVNEYNEKFSSEVLRNLKDSYNKVKNQKPSERKQQIIDARNKAYLCYQLYSCLMEEDPERLRNAVQHFADENLNDIVSVLVDLGYVF